MAATYSKGLGNLAVQIGTTGCAAEARRDGVGVDDVRFVDMKRRECPNISWQALANMTQRNVHDLRMHCDPEYAARFGGSVVSPQAPTPPKETPVEDGRRNPRRAEGAREARATALAVRRARREGFDGPVHPGTTQAKLVRRLRAGVQTAATLASALQMPAVNVTSLLRPLVEREVVDRRIPDRGRAFLYALTEKGEAVAEALDALERAHG